MTINEPKDVPYWTTKSGLNVYEMEAIELNDRRCRLNISEWDIPKNLTKEEYIDQIKEPHHTFVVICTGIKKVWYVCDNSRHLVCIPYSIANLHKMAKDLNIKRCWFHKDHYDIPKRRILEIMNKCTIVTTEQIVKLIGRDERRRQIRIR